MKPWVRRKTAAWVGSIAASTPGRSMTHGSPASAMLANQTSVIGPKTAPTRAVPRRWTRNRHPRIATVSGTTHGASDGAPNSSPFTALSTEIAGVITPSP
jgi:hypothetical protein